MDRAQLLRAIMSRGAVQLSAPVSRWADIVSAEGGVLWVGWWKLCSVLVEHVDIAGEVVGSAA